MASGAVCAGFGKSLSITRWAVSIGPRPARSSCLKAASVGFCFSCFS
ncbi:MAG: hypothetical protein MRQ08_05800 [Candidatus Midichloria mitochondrii]|nr:hypothetical protein [Candidatus Midichloria mitochondrii]MDJ1288714.1 hypothetical protein [Candidatus Midichloria mitochondrii]